MHGRCGTKSRSKWSAREFLQCTTLAAMARSSGPIPGQWGTQPFRGETPPKETAGSANCKYVKKQQWPSPATHTSRIPGGASKVLRATESGVSPRNKTRGATREAGVLLSGVEPLSKTVCRNGTWCAKVPNTVSDQAPKLLTVKKSSVALSRPTSFETVKVRFTSNEIVVAGQRAHAANATNHNQRLSPNSELSTFESGAHTARTRQTKVCQHK